MIRTNLRNISRLAKPASLVSRSGVAVASRPAMIPRYYSTSLQFTEEEEMFRDVVAKFSEEVVAPKVRDMDEAEEMDPEIVKAMFDNGLMGIETPEEYGGAGASFTSAIIVIEELAKVDPSVSVLNDVHNTLVNNLVLQRGSEELKQKYAPQLATEKVGAFCLSEPSSGSDAFALKTRAEDKGDHYVINGSKMWITNSKEAELFIVMANLDPSKGYKGITAFMVEKDMGVQIAKKEKKLGIKASSTCVLNFDDVKVPKENLIGVEGHGYKYAIEGLNEGRIGIAAQMYGLARGSFEKATKYMFNDRKQFGQYIGDFQGMQFQVAEAAVLLETSRLLIYNAARLKEEGKPFMKEAAMAKWHASTSAQKIASQAVDWMGGVGFTREETLEKFYRDSKIGTIYEGTSNIQLQTIAKAIQKEVKA